MDWLIFTYLLPAEPSRKRVFVWRQLKKLGAVSVEGAGWILPKTEVLSAKITDIMRTVEEMEGTSNLYIAAHFSEAQEQRTIDKFQQGREKEYSEIINECHKTLQHVEREFQSYNFSFEEVQELESDLEKIKRWFSDASQRDFWEVNTRKEVRKMIDEVEAKLADFIQKTYEVSQNPPKETNKR